jgi:hypothetical protein
MKSLLILLVALSLGLGNAFAEDNGPLSTLEGKLGSMLKNVEGRKTLENMKTVANDRNTEVEVAFQSYIIAKKNITIARAAFNPITTTQLLGLSLGWGYLWAPMIADAVLSIPMKIYDVQKNKYLAQTAINNLHEARDVLNNELAHLYYDILTHEIILNSIDEEIRILTYYEDELNKREPLPLSRLDEAKGSIIALKIERIDIYNLYVQELAAFKTLIRTEINGFGFELAHVSRELSKADVGDVDPKDLPDFALNNSHQYKASSNLYRASLMNVGSVRWSVLSFSGMNFSYAPRVRVARNEQNIALLKKQTTELIVKNNVLLQFQKLDSSLEEFANYNSISNESIAYFVDTYDSYIEGKVTLDAAVQSALDAIRDFRSKAVTHYNAWSSLDDFGLSSNFDFSVEATGKTLADQLATNSNYGMEYEVIKTNGVNDSFTLTLDTNNEKNVQSVGYRFDKNVFPFFYSTFVKGGFRVVHQKGAAATEGATGIATIFLKNGHNFEVKFKL